MALDNGLDNLELRIFYGDRVRDCDILELQVLLLLTLMDDKIHVIPRINNQVRSVTLTNPLQPYQGIQEAVPLILETITHP